MDELPSPDGNCAITTGTGDDLVVVGGCAEGLFRRSTGEWQRLDQDARGFILFSDPVVADDIVLRLVGIQNRVPAFAGYRIETGP